MRMCDVHKKATSEYQWLELKQGFRLVFIWVGTGESCFVFW